MNAAVSLLDSSVGCGPSLPQEDEQENQPLEEECRGSGFTWFSSDRTVGQRRHLCGLKILRRQATPTDSPQDASPAPSSDWTVACKGQAVRTTHPRILIDYPHVDVPFVPVDFLHSEKSWFLRIWNILLPKAQVLLHPTAEPLLQALWQAPLQVKDSDGPLEFPNASTFFGDLLHRSTHEGDEHVKQQNVGEDDVGDEQHIEHLLVLVVVCELQVTHANSELEQFQGGVGDALKRGLLTLLAVVHTSEECSAMFGASVLKDWRLNRRGWILIRRGWRLIH